MEGLPRIVTMVEKGLKEYFDREISGVSGFEKLLWESTAEFTLRSAKRVRAALVYYGYKMFGGQDESAILYPMMAVELFHAGLLMHDDVIDEDLVRRGKPTLHASMAERYSDRKYGESMAICTGDLSMLAAEELLTEGVFADGLKIKAIRICSRGIMRTAIGEALDTELQTKGDASESEILEMLNLKTSIYTFANPLALGAVLAGASDADLAVLEKYSQNLGIAFQMTDDILGMFGDEAKTGKSADSDIRQGKMTLLSNKVQDSIFKQLYGKRDITNAEVSEVRKIVEQESLSKVKKMIEEYGKEARVAVEVMRGKKWNSEGTDFLAGLVDYVMRREK